MYNLILFLHFCNKKEKTNEIFENIYVYKILKGLENNRAKSTKKHVRIKSNKNKIYETFSQHFLFYNYSSIHRVK